jgi:hypothetical protein
MIRDFKKKLYDEFRHLHITPNVIRMVILSLCYRAAFDAEVRCLPDVTELRFLRTDSALRAFVWVYFSSRPPLWSSGQSSWIQIRRPGFDSRHYQKQKR